jgi:ERCC4-type nuclease
MFNVREDGFYFDSKRLGPREALYVESELFKNFTEEKHGVIHMVMPERVDMAFAAGKWAVTCESKKIGDLESSIKIRRLARQLRTILTMGDVQGLVLRGHWPDMAVLDHQFMLVELVRIQALGIFLLPCPLSDNGALARLYDYRAILSGGSRSALAAIKGSDLVGTRGESLLTSIKGVGPVMEKKLRTKFGTTAQVLQASAKDLKALGVNPKVIKSIRKAAK